MAWDKVGKHATTIAYDYETDKQVLTFHSTQIVKWDSGEILLNSGGWETATTKTRMNQCSYQYGLGYRVYQKDWIWYVDYGDNEAIPFQDGMILDRQTKQVKNGD